MRRAIALVLIALISAGIALGAMNARAQENSGRLGDIAIFRSQFLVPDRSFGDSARQEAERRLDSLEARAQSMSAAAFELELARIIALADNGHTTVFSRERAGRFNRAPVRLAPFGEDFHVIRAARAQADLLGAQLVAIDGHAIADLRGAARTLHGGTAAWRDRFAPYLLESPALLHALGLADRDDRARYRFRLRDGRLITRLLLADAPDANAVNGVRALFPAPAADEAQGWRSALAPPSAPWSLQEPDAPYRLRDAPELDAIVVEFRQNSPSGRVDLAQFFFSVDDLARATGRRHLVLDMRLNGGGDLNTTRYFMRRLPTMVEGRIFVLTSPWTFSAAISSIGYLKQSAPQRVTIVGEQVGDRLHFFAEGNVVTLPHSGLRALNATERHDYLTGCRGYDDCHGSVVRAPIAVRSLAPDIEAPWSIEAYLAGRDPGMEAIAEAVR